MFLKINNQRRIREVTGPDQEIVQQITSRFVQIKLMTYNSLISELLLNV